MDRAKPQTKQKNRGEVMTVDYAFIHRGGGNPKSTRALSTEILTAKVSYKDPELVSLWAFPPYSTRQQCSENV